MFPSDEPLRRDLIEESVTSVKECLNKREYLTICWLGQGGSEKDIELAILSALQKGMQAL